MDDTVVLASTNVLPIQDIPEVEIPNLALVSMRSAKRASTIVRDAPKGWCRRCQCIARGCRSRHGRYNDEVVLNKVRRLVI